MSKNEIIKKRANLLIKRAGTRDPLKIAAAEGIAVRYKNLGGTIAAYYFCQSRIRNIVLSKALDEENIKIIAAHELGHDSLHREILKNGAAYDDGLFRSNAPLEYEANLFAAELLIDSRELFGLLSERDMAFFEIAAKLGVPPELLDFKLRLFSDENIHMLSPITARGNYLKNYLAKKCG
ncbi:MAG: ImmA/IrrE family metallo-endopeptidase [Ruminococcus sp.]|jgi:Zn-dependent peptidase ImmA (M78 family)|nr:ImmA/IrrE family metallo-endopeptidase [Ruminococcus sp.]